VTDLAGTQLSNLLETLPGIANVLRSPVADAIVGLIRSGSGQTPFSMVDAEELLRYAVRRNLVPADESERVLAETRQFLASGGAKAQAKAAAKAHKPAPARKPAKAAAKPAKAPKPPPKKKAAAKPPAKPPKPAHKKK
jgi:hypothetical protein